MLNLRFARRRLQPLLVYLTGALGLIVLVRLATTYLDYDFPVVVSGNFQGDVENPYGFPANVLEVQTARNETIHKVCDMRRPLKKLSKVDQRILLNHLIVEPKHKLLYCYVPKVACTNWKDTVRHLQSTSDYEVVESHDDHNEGLRMLNSYSEEEADIILRTYFKFIFVRNPISRLISAFQDKFRNEPYMMKRYGIDIVRECRGSSAGYVEGDDVSFSEFICYLLKHPLDEFNEHWMPAHKLCQPCTVNYDFIGKYEQLEEEANTVLKIRAASSGLMFPHRQARYHPMEQSKKTALLRTLTVESLQKLHALYYKDFSLFMYRETH